MAKTYRSSKTETQEWQAHPARNRVRFRACNIGFVFQQYQLIPALSIQKSVSVPLLIQGSNRSVAMDSAAE